MMTREVNIPVLSDSLKFGVSTAFGLTNEPKFGGCFGERFSLLINETDQTYPIPPFITASAHWCAAQHCSGQLAKWRRGPKILRVPGSSIVEPQDLDFLLWRKNAPWFLQVTVIIFQAASCPADSQLLQHSRLSCWWVSGLWLDPVHSGYSAYTMKSGTVDRVGPCILGLNGFISVSLRGTQGRQRLGHTAAAQHYKQKRRQKPQAHSAWEQSRVERATRCLTEPHSFSSKLALRPRMELHCLLTP